MDVLLLDAGLAAACLGLISIAKPLGVLHIHTRSAGALVLAVGVLLAVLAALLPTGPIELGGPPMRIDETIARYQFGEHHEIRVHAPGDRVYRAMRDVTAGEIRLFRLLTWLRSPQLPGRGRASIMNAPEARPILDVALRSGFVLVAEEPGREIVFGTVVCCDGARATSGEELAHLDRPGVAKAIMNFHVTDAGGGFTRVITETRIFATDKSAERRFGVYWRVIYPGSALIRRMWLRAIRDRAERSPA
jgi:hypothetical protein